MNLEFLNGFNAFAGTMCHFLIMKCVLLICCVNHWKPKFKSRKPSKFIALVISMLIFLPNACLSSQAEKCKIGINEVSLYDDNKQPGFIELRVFSCESLQHVKVLIIELFHEKSRRISFVADLKNVEPLGLLIIGPPSMPEADLKYDDDGVAYWKKLKYDPKSSNQAMFQNVLSEAASRGPIAVAVVYDPDDIIVYTRENSKKTNYKLVVENDLLQFLLKENTIVNLLAMEGKNLIPVMNVTEVIVKGIRGTFQHPEL